MAAFALLGLAFLLILIPTAILMMKLLSPATVEPTYGPKSYPIIGCLLSFYRNRHRLLHWYTDLLAASPSNTITLSRLGARRNIITSNPSNVEHILSSNFSNYPEGKPFTDILRDLLGHGIFNSERHLWISQRNGCGRSVSPHNFIDKVLLSGVYAHFPLIANGRTVVDLQNHLRELSFRVICHMFLRSSTTNLQLAEALDISSAISARRGATSLALLWNAKRVLDCREERLHEAVDLIHRFVIDIIQTKRATNNLLSRLVAKWIHQEEDEESRDMTISLLMADRDVTSSALTWFFWLISTHPNVKEKILKEIDWISKIQREKAMSCELLKEFKYIEASLMESMRLYPPVIWDSKHAAEDDILPDGTMVKKGDKVTYFPYGMGRMEEIWGADWKEFRPERWIVATDRGRELLRVSSFKFPVLWAGPRVCLEGEMSMVLMKFLAWKVLREYELSWVGRKEPELVPLQTAHMAGGLPMVVTFRR